jgi:hypothetical protein
MDPWTPVPETPPATMVSTTTPTPPGLQQHHTSVTVEEPHFLAARDPTRSHPTDNTSKLLLDFPLKEVRGLEARSPIGTRISFRRHVV